MAFLYAYLFVGGILFLATLLDKFKFFTDEHSRKFIHIAVSHWFILAMFTFDDPYLAAFVPFTFIIFNYLSYRFNLVKAMERDKQDTSDLGTVYYAVSLTIITFVAFRFDYLNAGLFAVLAMGYGDAFGAIICRKVGGIKLFGTKTLAGSLTIFLTIVALGIFLLDNHVWEIIIIAIMASFIELYTKKGFDNLTMPLSIFFVLVLIL